MIITAEHVRQLLSSPEDDPTLVVRNGAASVVSGADPAGEGEPASMVVVGRDDLRRLAHNLDLDHPSARDLEELAQRLSSTVAELGG